MRVKLSDLLNFAVVYVVIHVQYLVKQYNKSTFHKFYGIHFTSVKYMSFKFIILHYTKLLETFI